MRRRRRGNRKEDEVGKFNKYNIILTCQHLVRAYRLLNSSIVPLSVTSLFPNQHFKVHNDKYVYEYIISIDIHVPNTIQRILASIRNVDPAIRAAEYWKMLMYSNPSQCQRFMAFSIETPDENPRKQLLVCLVQAGKCCQTPGYYTPGVSS